MKRTGIITIAVVATIIGIAACWYLLSPLFIDNTVELGSLKGNVGNQNYEIPGDIDLSKYQSVVIYCMPFHVVFSTATLS